MLSDNRLAAIGAATLIGSVVALYEVGERNVRDFRPINTEVLKDYHHSVTHKSLEIEGRLTAVGEYTYPGSNGFTSWEGTRFLYRLDDVYVVSNNVLSTDITAVRGFWTEYGDPDFKNAKNFTERPNFLFETERST